MNHNLYPQTALLSPKKIDILTSDIDDTIVLHIMYRWKIEGEECMEIVKVSPKYQVVVPLRIRKSLGIKAGTKVHVLQYENRIEYIPVKDIKKMRGFLQGIDTTIIREKDRI